MVRACVTSSRNTKRARTWVTRCGPCSPSRSSCAAKVGDVRTRSVLRLITRLNVGGPAQQALLLTAYLGDEFPTVLAAGTPTAEEGELSHPDVPVHRLPL